MVPIWCYAAYPYCFIASCKKELQCSEWHLCPLRPETLTQSTNICYKSYHRCCTLQYCIVTTCKIIYQFSIKSRAGWVNNRYFALSIPSCVKNLNNFNSRNFSENLINSTCNVACYIVLWLCKGRLILNVNKDIYTQLGLEGRPSKFTQKQKSRYVINIDLISAHFHPSKKNYKRVQWCFTDRLNLVFDFIITWVPFGNEQNYFCSVCYLLLFVFENFYSMIPYFLCVVYRFAYGPADATATHYLLLQ